VKLVDLGHGEHGNQPSMPDRSHPAVQRDQPRFARLDPASIRRESDALYGLTGWP
jgi:hypothetical protein